MLLPSLWTIEGKCLLIVWWIELANRLQGATMVNSTNQNYTIEKFACKKEGISFFGSHEHCVRQNRWSFNDFDKDYRLSRSKRGNPNHIVTWNIWQKSFVTIGDFLYEKLFLHLLKSGYHKIMSYLTKKLLNCLCLWQEEVGTKHFIAMLFRGSTTRMLISNLSEIASYFGLSEFPPSFVFHRWVTYSNTYLS